MKIVYSKLVLSGQFKNGLVVLLVILLLGCASRDPDPYRALDRLASAHGFSKRYLDSGTFQLLSLQRVTALGQPVNIYLEGDGAAWRTRSQLAVDPTPHQQLVMELAALDPAANVVYLARPCQYVIREGLGRGCEPTFWSSARFGETMVEAVNRSIDLIRDTTKTSHLNLIGYSGGGALAVLVAARRDDVVSLRTIAGNLDHQAFTNYHHVTSLTGSLDLSRVAGIVEQIPQIHFTGQEDEIIPTMIAENFLAQQDQATSCAELVQVERVGHHAGWTAAWPELLKRPLPSCSATNK